MPIIQHNNCNSPFSSSVAPWKGNHLWEKTLANQNWVSLQVSSSTAQQTHTLSTWLTLSKLFYCRIIFCQLYIQRYIKISSLKPVQNNMICNFLKNTDWRQQNSTAFPDDAAQLYCTPLHKIAWICLYSTGLHIHNPLFTT